MGAFKKLAFSISKSSKETLVRFPLTIGLIIIITTFTSLFISRSDELDKIITNVIVFGIIFSCKTFFCECYFKRWTYRTITYLLGAVISVIFTIIINFGELGLANYKDFMPAEALKIAGGYVIILVFLSLYKILKVSKLKFEEYILKVFSNLFMSGITYFILNIGITLISLVFIELILDGRGGEFILRTEILIFGYFLINSLVFSISNVKDKNVNAFIKGLVNYVVLPLVTISMAIIYAYIIKIIIQSDMPSNIIFRILAGIFIVAFPTWNMAGNFKENKIISKVCKVIPYAYCPFILLEIYSVFVRIINYGLTPLRYACAMFIIFQIIALLFTFIKKEILSYLFLVIGFLVLISFISPLNYEKMSCVSQNYILTKYYEQDTDVEKLNDNEKQKVISSYNFLNEKSRYSVYIPSYIETEKIDYLKSKSKNSNGYSFNEENNSREQYTFYNQNIDIDVSNYSRIINVESKDSTGDGSNISFYNGGKVEANANLKDYINDLIKLNEDEFNQTLENKKIIAINDKEDLYITSMYITFNSNDKKIKSVDITGYILYR